MSWCPRLRDDVDLERDGDGRVVALVDRPLGRRVPVGPVTRALVARLDGTTPADALDADALRALLLLHLIDGAGAATVELVRRGGAGGEPRTLDGARFGCAGSGACCQVFRPGPLQESDVARLEAARERLHAAWADAPAGPWFEEAEGAQGERLRYLRRVDGRCLFLRPDGLCGVHASVGPEAKPDMCNLFPFDAVRPVDGPRLFDVSLCSSFAVTSAQGRAHAEQAPEVLRLLPARLPLHHPLVLLDGATPCDFGPVLRLSDRLVELARRPGPAGARLGAVAATCRAFALGLAACPLAPGEPDATVARLLAAEPPPLPLADPVEVAGALEAVGVALLEASQEDGEREASLAPAFREALQVASAWASADAGLVDDLPDVVRRARAVRVDADEVGRVVGASLANRLFGLRLLVEGRLRAGVLRLALVQLLALAVGRVRAAARGADVLGAADLSAGHWVASLALSRPGLARALIPVERHAWTVASWAGA